MLSLKDITIFIHHKLTPFEVAAGAGILALVSDVSWLIHDILLNGLNFWYLTILIGLVIGITVTGSAWISHYCKEVRVRKRFRRK